MTEAIRNTAHIGRLYIASQRATGLASYLDSAARQAASQGAQMRATEVAELVERGEALVRELRALAGVAE